MTRIVEIGRGIVGTCTIHVTTENTVSAQLLASAKEVPKRSTRCSIPRRATFERIEEMPEEVLEP